MNNISSTNIITLNRGDTFSFKYRINLGDELNPKNYILTEKDTLYLGVCEPKQSFEDALIKKIFTHDDMTEDYVTISFKSLDTEYVRPGQYYYTIKLCKNKGLDNEEIITTVSKKLFWIIGEVSLDNKINLNK